MPSFIARILLLFGRARSWLAPWLTLYTGGGVRPLLSCPRPEIARASSIRDLAHLSSARWARIALITEVCWRMDRWRVRWGLLMAAPNPETKGPCTGRAADCECRDAPGLASGQPPPPLPTRD